MKLTQYEQFLAHAGKITKIPAQKKPTLPNHGGVYGKKSSSKGLKSLQRSPEPIPFTEDRKSTKEKAPVKPAQVAPRYWIKGRRVLGSTFFANRSADYMRRHPEEVYSL